jgi:hypothetical protein
MIGMENPHQSQFLMWISAQAALLIYGLAVGAICRHIAMFKEYIYVAEYPAGGKPNKPEENVRLLDTIMQVCQQTRT